MPLFSRFSLSRFFLLYTATDCPYSTFHLRRHFSVERVRNIWISGLMDPSNAKSKCILYKNDLIDEKHEQDLRKFQHLRFFQFKGKKSLYYDLCGDYIADPAAITFLAWKNYKINIIHTPDRVDNFTLEVDNALCSFDSAIHVLSSVDEVQSQSISVDKQMIRYQIPRLVYINHLNKKGANPWQVLNQARSKFEHHSAAIQVPIGLEDDFKGLVDLVQLKAYSFHGSKRGKVEVPANMEALVLEKRHELIKTVSEVDDKLAGALCSDKPISASALEEAVRRATIARKFIPVFMGTAFKYKGLQLLLDGVLNYLPSPIEASNYVLDQKFFDYMRKEKKKRKTKNYSLGNETPKASANNANERAGKDSCNQTRDSELLDQFKNEEKHTLVALAFTLNRKYHLRRTYLRIYKGVLQKGDFITNVHTRKTFQVDCFNWVPYDEVIQEAHAGEIVAAPYFYDASGDTLTDGIVISTMTSTDVPELVSRDS